MYIGPGETRVQENRSPRNPGEPGSPGLQPSAAPRLSARAQGDLRKRQVAEAIARIEARGQSATNAAIAAEVGISIQRAQVYRRQLLDAGLVTITPSRSGPKIGTDAMFRRGLTGESATEQIEIEGQIARLKARRQRNIVGRLYTRRVVHVGRYVGPPLPISRASDVGLSLESEEDPDGNDIEENGG